MSLMLVSVGAIVPAAAQAVAQSYQLNIPRQDLDAALKDLAQQTGLQIARFSDTPEGSAFVGPVRGTMPVTDALKSLLTPNKLTYKIVNDHTIAVMTLSAAAAVESTGVATSLHPGSPTASESAPQEGKKSASGVFRLAQVDQGSNTQPAGIAKSASSSPENLDNGNLSEIIVTAEKRHERLQDVPSSVTVLSGSKLEEEGVAQLSDYVKQVPGLNIIGASGPGQGQVVLRGITTGADDGPLVGIYLDDIPFTPSSPNAHMALALDPDLADVERIEVLEGPQSTLYGASAMGGLLKFVTKQPDLNSYDGDVRISEAQTDGGGTGYGVRGSVNIPLMADVVGIRASTFYRDDPGFVENDFNRVKDINHDSVKGARLVVRVKFSDDVETTVSGLAENIDAAGTNQVYLNPSTLQPSLGRYAYSSLINQPTAVQFQSVGDTTTLNLPFATLKNIASFAKLTDIAVADIGSVLAYFPGLAPPGSGVSDANDIQSRRFSDELQLASVPGRIEWLLGGFYTHERDPENLYFRGTNAAGTIFPSSSLLYNVYTYYDPPTFDEWAVFGDVTYHLTDQIQATVGTRYSANKQSSDLITSGLLGTGNDVQSESSDSAESYLATLSYKPTSHATLYLRAASAYQPGGPNILNNVEMAAGVPPTFRASTLWNYEGGIKGSAWDERLTYSADAYHMRWTDIQLSVFSSGFESIGNAASAKSDGAEASIQVVPVEHLTINLKGAYNDAKLTADAPSLGAVSGDSLPYAPKFSTAAVMDYQLASFNNISPRAGLTYGYHTSQYSAYTNGTRYDLPGYGTLDVRGGFDWSRYSVIATVTNVTDKYGITSTTAGAAAGTPLVATIVKPRTVGLAIAAHF